MISWDTINASSEYAIKIKKPLPIHYRKHDLQCSVEKVLSHIFFLRRSRRKSAIFIIGIFRKRAFVRDELAGFGMRKAFYEARLWVKHVLINLLPFAQALASRLFKFTFNVATETSIICESSFFPGSFLQQKRPTPYISFLYLLITSEYFPSRPRFRWLLSRHTGP